MIWDATGYTQQPGQRIREWNHCVLCWDARRPAQLPITQSRTE